MREADGNQRRGLQSLRSRPKPALLVGPRPGLRSTQCGHNASGGSGRRGELRSRPEPVRLPESRTEARAASGSRFALPPQVRHPVTALPCARLGIPPRPRERPAAVRVRALPLERATLRCVLGTPISVVRLHVLPIRLPPLAPIRRHALPTPRMQAGQHRRIRPKRPLIEPPATTRTPPLRAVDKPLCHGRPIPPRLAANLFLAARHRLSVVGWRVMDTPPLGRGRADR